MNRADTSTPDALFEHIQREYGRWLRAAVARLCPRGMGIQPEDIEQEVAVRLWRALQSEREIRHPASYIHRVVSTATLDAIRRVRSRREDPLVTAGGDGEEDGASPDLEAPDASPERVAAHGQLRAQLAHLVGDLPENRRRTVRLYLQGLNTREIGDLLGWTEAKARNLLYRGLKTVREGLRAAGFEYEEP